MDRSALVVACLMIALTTAGCIGSSGGPADADLPANGTPTDADDTGNATPADAAPTAIDHVHDRWDGESEKVLFDDTVTTGSATDASPDKTVLENLVCAFTCSAEAEFTPADGKIIPPGTDRVVVDASWEDPAANDQAPLRVHFMYQAANMAEYDYESYRTEPGRWELNTSVEMADGGHAEQSLWKFRFYLQREEGTDYLYMSRIASTEFEIDVTVTAHRVDGELPEEPAHPDWFADGPRTLYRNSGSGTATGAVLFYAGSDGSTGEYLNGTQHGIVPPGTKRLTMTVNWTNEADTSDTLPARPFVRYSAEFGFAAWTRWTPETTEDGRYTFEMAVGPSEHDGMYAQRSRWVFLWYLDGEELGPEEPIFGYETNQPYRFDGSWSVQITAHPTA